MPSIRRIAQHTTGTVHLPASKSISNRLLVLQALSGHKLELIDLSRADDTLLLQQCLSDMHAGRQLWAGNAGTVARFMTALLAVTEGEWELRGDERMQQRPIAPLVDALRQCGADIQYGQQEGSLPLIIRGQSLPGGEVQLVSGISSQFASALLMVAPTFRNGLRLQLIPPVVSLPYLDMTLALMTQCGLKVHRDGNTLTVAPSMVRPGVFHIENDWSSASFFYALTALAPASQLELPGLQPQSLQGDAVLSDWFAQLGVRSTFTEAGLTLAHQPAVINDITLDFTHHPDLFLPLAITCAGLGCGFTARGVETLVHKESDRLSAMASALRSLGFSLQFSRERFHLEAAEPWLQTQVPPTLDVCADHRLAMSLALLATRFPVIRLNNTEVVSKSFPGYFDTLGNLGFYVSNE